MKRLHINIEGERAANDVPPGEKLEWQTATYIVDEPEVVYKKQPEVSFPTVNQGREAWRQLHTKTDPTTEWFETEWKPLIPQGCGCAGSANQLLDQNPPRFDSPEEFFVWTVEYHNAVNQKLINQGDTTKKIVSLEEAKQIWNRE